MKAFPGFFAGASSPPVTVLLDDTFIRADGNIGTASDGHVWVSDTEFSTVPMVISGNLAKSGNPGGAAFAVYDIGIDKNFTLTCDMVQHDDFPQMVYRTDNRWSVGDRFRIERRNGNIELVTDIGGTGALILSVPDIGGRVGINVDNANNHTILLDGVSQGSVNSAALLGNTFVGMRSNYAGATTLATFSHFRATTP